MAETKYGKYFVEEPFREGHFVTSIRFFAGHYFSDKNYSLLWNCITEAFMMEDRPHSHEFDQFLHFYGGNPRDITDFGAEVEFSLGEEGEKHIINKTTVVYIPKGTIHCPLYFKRVDRPIIFMNVAFTPDYHATRPEIMEKMKEK
jgi:hypothetical protein